MNSENSKVGDIMRKYSRLSIAFSSIGLIGIGLRFLSTVTHDYFLFGFIIT